MVKYKNCTHLNETVGITAKIIIINSAALYIGSSGEKKDIKKQTKSNEAEQYTQTKAGNKR